MLMDYGMAEEGRNVVRAVHDRYARAGQSWNHVECGSHYYRAMSSWAILLGSTGFKLDMPRQSLTISPVYDQDRMRAPWVASTAWGNFTQTPRRLDIGCLGGSLDLKELRVKLPADGLKVRLNNRLLKSKSTAEDGIAVVQLEAAFTFKAGDALVIA
jgi:hypothetical protein